MFYTVIRKLTALLMAVISAAISPMFGDFTAAFTPKDAESVKLTFAAISDTHIQESDVYDFMLGLGLEDMSDAVHPLDAVVHAGDITDHGEREQWEKVEKIFKDHCKVKNIILATGNHDTWTDGPDGSASLYKEYNEKICGRTIENVYYSEKINGYTFIVLGSEDDGTNAYFTEAQLAWLAGEMEAASADGLPIFVICHQPLNYWHGLPDTWSVGKETDPIAGGIGEQSDEVEAILTGYENVFFINGHIHDGFGDQVTGMVFDYKSIESKGSFHSINVPCYSYLNTRGQNINGQGFQFEVYDDRVVIRGRGYTDSIWYTCYDYSIELV